MLTNNNFVFSCLLCVSWSSGNGQPASASQYNLVQVKQEPVDTNPGASQDSTQEHSLDLSKKDHRYTAAWCIEGYCYMKHVDSCCKFPWYIHKTTTRKYVFWLIGDFYILDSQGYIHNYSSKICDLHICAYNYKMYNILSVSIFVREGCLYKTSTPLFLPAQSRSYFLRRQHFSSSLYRHTLCDK